MARQVQVNYQEKPCYKIILNHSFDGFLDALEQEGIARDRKICIVTDTNVAKLYLNEVTEICKNAFPVVEYFVFDAGESSKNMATVEKLYEYLIKSR